MHPRLRRFLHDRDIAIERFHRSPEARRPKILTTRGVTTIFDLGASVGMYAYLLRNSGYLGRIVSVEPVAAAFDQLVARSASDPAWDAVKVAVADKPGEADMRVSESLSFSSLLPVRDEFVSIDPKASSQRTERVPVSTLDAIVATYAQEDETIAVKMDVQGAEWRVMDGGEHALRRAAVLEMELALIPSYEGERLAPDLLLRVLDCGFRLALVENVMQEPDGSAPAINGIFVRSAGE
jgi:FkbM family methyltransferase